MTAKPTVLEFGMGVDVHGRDATKAACRAVPDPGPVNIDIVRREIVRRELPHGEVTVHAVSGGLQVPGADTIIACAAITVSIEYPEGQG